MEKVCDIKYYVKYILLFCNSVFAMWPSMFQFSVIFGMEFEVLRVVRIHNVVWVRHLLVWYVHINEWFGGAFWFCLHRPSDDGSSRSRPNRVCWPFRLHGPITEKTAISNLHMTHFHCIMSLCYKNSCTHIRQYTALLFYIILWYQQKWVTGNIIKNSKVYVCM